MLGTHKSHQICIKTLSWMRRRQFKHSIITEKRTKKDFFLNNFESNIFLPFGLFFFYHNTKFNLNDCRNKIFSCKLNNVRGVMKRNYLTKKIVNAKKNKKKLFMLNKIVMLEQWVRGKDFFLRSRHVKLLLKG